MIRKLLAVVCCFALCLSLAACTTGFDSLEYTEIESSDKPSDTLIAQNSEYKLELDKTNMGLVLTDISTGQQWSTTPIDAQGPQVDEFGMPIKKHPRVESILAVECKNFEKDEINTYYSYTDAVKDGYITHEKIDNGIVINYHFAQAKIMIPLECTLTKKGVKLSVNPEKIQESENKVIGLSIAPFFCGVKNDTENSYLLVPSGSGALVGVASKSQQGDIYSAQVFGADPAIDEVALVSTKEAVRLNVFGSKANDKAMCAIIDSSAASANINVVSGSTSLGYSSCYATFIMRGYTNHIAELFSYEKVQNVVYSKKMINKPVSVTFIPLGTEESANYSGMANTYREYLTETYGMNKSAQDIALNLRVLGGTEMDKSFLGIPYKTVYATTTLSATKNIIDEAKAQLGNNFAVQLKGFGESGLDVGKIAGNYTVNKNLGSLEELKNLFSYSKENGIDIYFDFDMERFNKNSSGASKFFDSATNAGELKAMQYYYDVAVRDKKLDTAYNLLSPAAFTRVFEKVAQKTDKYNFSGISFDSLSMIAYSDYTNKDNSEFYSKNGFADAAQNVIKAAKSQDKRFMASGANIYAAALADIIAESPVISEKNQIFLYDIPFYQIVFKGSVPITVQSINLAADSRQMVLKAVESGSGLGYTVTDSWDSSVINAETPHFYNAVFNQIKDNIFETSKELSGYYQKISGKHITSHAVLENSLRETVFENGVVVYVNYTDKTLVSPAGEVAPYDYLITEK